MGSCKKQQWKADLITGSKARIVLILVQEWEGRNPELFSNFRSVGVISYMLLTHSSPFAGEDNQETYLNISQVNVDYSEEMFASISQLARDFIQKLLVKNPE